MDGTCIPNDGTKKHVQNFSRKTRREETTRKIKIKLILNKSVSGCGLDSSSSE
jgi:hypothetical protein